MTTAVARTDEDRLQRAGTVSEQADKHIEVLQAREHGPDVVVAAGCRPPAGPPPTIRSTAGARGSGCGAVPGWSSAAPTWHTATTPRTWRPSSAAPSPGSERPARAVAPRRRSPSGTRPTGPSGSAGGLAAPVAMVHRPDGTRIRALVRGSGPTAVLLLAPGGAHAGVQHWTPVHPASGEEWTSSFRSVLVDQRWAGASSTGVVAFDHELVAADHVAVLDALGLDSAHVVGVGVGAAEALALAASAPRRVGALALLDPLAIGHPRTWQELAGEFDESMRVVRADGFGGAFRAAARDPWSRAAGPFGELVAGDREFRAEVRALGRERYIARLVAFRDGLYPADRTFVSVTEDCAREIQTAAYVVPDPVAPAAGTALAAALPSSTLADPANPHSADAWSGIADFLRAHAA